MTKLAISIKKTKLTQIGHVTDTTVLTNSSKCYGGNDKNKTKLNSCNNDCFKPEIE